MSATEALRSALAHGVDFDGRASRTEFWWWFAWMLGFYVVSYLLIGLLASASAPGVALVVVVAYALVAFILFLPTIAVTARRFHDQGRSGWWMLMWFLPVVGWLLLLAAMVGDSEPRPNRWGPPPAGSVFADPATWEQPDT